MTPPATGARALVAGGRLAAAGLLITLVGVLAGASPASAHPLDQYLQSTYITVGPSLVDVEIDLSPGVLVAPAVLAALDADADAQISETETRTYADSALRQVALEVDGAARALTITHIESPAYLTVQAGYGVVRVFTRATLDGIMPGTHQLHFRSDFAPPNSSYQVNAFVDASVAVTLGAPRRDARQQQLDVSYTVSSAMAGASSVGASSGVARGPASAAVPSNLRVTNAGRLADALRSSPATPLAALVTFGLAALLGALHALTPGHGKTLVAAYLVGDRGTARHAVALGAIVTFTHTVSVIAIGLLVLFASHVVVPSMLAPALGVGSGVLVVFLGLRLFVQRWRALRRGRAGDDHDHDHGHGHEHSHVPPLGGITVGNLVAMGVSGGMVPCPEALGILIIAVGLNRVLFGLGLIVSFSFGLAAVLISIGLLLVSSRSLIERFFRLGGRWGRALPLVSAAVVVVLGIALTVKGFGLGRLPGL